MPGMQQVEDTIGECYPTLPSSFPPLGLCPCRNLCSGIARLQGLLITEGWKWMTRCLFIGSRMISS